MLRVTYNQLQVSKNHNLNNHLLAGEEVGEASRVLSFQEEADRALVLTVS